MDETRGIGSHQVSEGPCLSYCFRFGDTTSFFPPGPKKKKKDAVVLGLLSIRADLWNNSNFDKYLTTLGRSVPKEESGQGTLHKVPAG